MAQEVSWRFDPNQVTREAFAAWASEQNPEEEYDYTEPHTCALCQFIEFLSGEEVVVDPFTYRIRGQEFAYPRYLDRATNEETNTFGALAERLAKAA